jgi:hypothetical protein
MKPAVSQKKFRVLKTDKSKTERIIEPYHIHTTESESSPQ